MTSNVHHLPLTANAVLPPRGDRDWVTTSELIDDTHISYRQADYWTRTGLLTPLDNPNPGSGHLRRYHHDQVRRARVIYDLLHAGISLTTIREAIDPILTDGHADVGTCTITHHPREETA